MINHTLPDQTKEANEYLLVKAIFVAHGKQYQFGVGSVLKPQD
jgi:hypothetical protein